MKKAGLQCKDYFISVTGEKSPMDNPSRYLASFYIWDFIGGRYSATSMVGGVALAFALGHEQFMKILKGAHEMDLIALNQDFYQNLPLLSAMIGIWNRNFLHHSTIAILPYSQALQRFPAHLQQLNMESNGKRIDKFGNAVDFDTGPIVWGEPGTNGQHSFYQIIDQGTTYRPVNLSVFEKVNWALISMCMARFRKKSSLPISLRNPLHLLRERKTKILTNFSQAIDRIGFCWAEDLTPLPAAHCLPIMSI